MPFLLKRTRSNVLLFAAMVAASTVGAVSIGEAHTGHGWWCGAMYAAVVGTAEAWLFFGRVPLPALKRLSDVRIWLAVLVVIAAWDQVHYAATRQSADPLTSAQALEVPGRALLHGHEPYGEHLSRDAPISPGPGWIVLLLPLTAAHVTGVLCMAMLALAALCVRRRSPVGAGVLCAVLLLGPLFESQAANGQDLYCISLACAALALLLEEAAGRVAAVAFLGVLAGFVATARLPMVAMLCVPGLGVARRDRRSGLVFSTVMLGTAALLDGGFALWAARMGDRFQPMHVLGRGTNGAGYRAQTAVLVLAAAALLWIARWMRGRAEDWMLGMWLFMSALFVPEAVKEFGLMGHDLRWEGSTYMTFPLPLLIAALVVRANGSRILSCSEQGRRAATWSAGE